jgi:hypothetical protein
MDLIRKLAVDGYNSLHTSTQLPSLSTTQLQQPTTQSSPTQLQATPRKKKTSKQASDDDYVETKSKSKSKHSSKATTQQPTNPLQTTLETIPQDIMPPLSNQPTDRPMNRDQAIEWYINQIYNQGKSETEFPWFLSLPLDEQRRVRQAVMDTFIDQIQPLGFNDANPADHDIPVLHRSNSIQQRYITQIIEGLIHQTRYANIKVVSFTFENNQLDAIRHYCSSKKDDLASIHARQIPDYFLTQCLDPYAFEIVCSEEAQRTLWKDYFTEPPTREDLAYIRIEFEIAYKSVRDYINFETYYQKIPHLTPQFLMDKLFIPHEKDSRDTLLKLNFPHPDYYPDHIDVIEKIRVQLVNGVDYSLSTIPRLRLRLYPEEFQQIVLSLKWFEVKMPFKYLHFPSNDIALIEPLEVYQECMYYDATSDAYIVMKRMYRELRGGTDWTDAMEGAEEEEDLPWFNKKINECYTQLPRALQIRLFEKLVKNVEYLPKSLEELHIPIEVINGHHISQKNATTKSKSSFTPQ